MRHETLMEPSSNSLSNTMSFAGTRFLGKRVFAGHLNRTHPVDGSRGSLANSLRRLLASR
jgi:hypothetical protein